MRWGSTWRYTVYEHIVCAYNILCIYISSCLQKELHSGCMTILCSPVQRSLIALYIIEMWDEIRIDMAVYSISTSSMCLHYPWHAHQPLLEEGAAQWLYNHVLQHSEEESDCSVYNRDVRWDEDRHGGTQYMIILYILTLSLISISAPACTRSCIVAVRPFSAALCRGVKLDPCI